MQNRRKTERAALDLPGLEPGHYLRQTAHLPNHHIPVRHKSVLTEKYSRKKIRDGSDPGNSDAFTAQLLDTLNIWLGHRKDKHPIYRYGDIDRVRPREFGVHTRRSADRCHVDTSAHKRLDRSRSGGDIDQLNIQTMALEYACLFRNPRYREGRSDRGVGDAELLQSFRGITRLDGGQEKEASPDQDRFSCVRQKRFHSVFSSQNALTKPITEANKIFLTAKSTKVTKKICFVFYAFFVVENITPCLCCRTRITRKSPCQYSRCHQLVPVL